MLRDSIQIFIRLLQEPSQSSKAELLTIAEAAAVGMVLMQVAAAEAAVLLEEASGCRLILLLEARIPILVLYKPKAGMVAMAVLPRLRPAAEAELVLVRVVVGYT